MSIDEIKKIDDFQTIGKKNKKKISYDINENFSNIY